MQNLWGLTRRRALDFGRFYDRRLLTPVRVSVVLLRSPERLSFSCSLVSAVSRSRRKSSSPWWVGVVLGLIAREIGPVADGTPNWLTSTLQTVGGTFVTLLKVLVPPLIVTAVIVSIANLKQVSNAARLAGRTLLWFAITALIAVSIGIGLGPLTNPGRNSSVDAATAQGHWDDWWLGGTSSPVSCPATSSDSRRHRTTTARSGCRSTCCS